MQVLRKLLEESELQFIAGKRFREMQKKGDIIAIDGVAPLQGTAASSASGTHPMPLRHPRCPPGFSMDQVIGVKREEDANTEPGCRYRH